MLLREKVTLTAERCREFKLNAVREHTEPDPDGCNTQPTMLGFRGDTQVVTAILLGCQGAEEMLQQAALLINGFGLDSVVLANETYFSKLEKNPVTGEAWGQGEMHKVAREHDGIEQGHVTEAMNVIGVNRAGDVIMSQQAFKLTAIPTPAEGIVQWEIKFDELMLPDEDESGEQKLGGRVPDTLKRIMELPNMHEKALLDPDLPEELRTASPDEMAAVLDCSFVRMVAEMQLMNVGLMLDAEPGSIRSEVIETMLGGLPNSQFFRPGEEPTGE